MSDHRLPTDDGNLSAWILEHPEVWGLAVEAPTTTVQDDAVRRITSGRHAAERAYEFTRRRRRAIAGGALAIAVLAGGSVGVAALIRSGQPDRPNEGITCRAAADLRADAIVIDIKADPVAECATVWSEGKFAAPGSEPAIPELAVCIADAGNIEVFPGDQSVCARLGLTASDSTLSPENDAVVALSDRVTNEINLADCASAAAATDAAQLIVNESGLKGWTVVVRPDSAGAACAKAAVDAPTRTVTIVKFP
ncbi:MAG: hypothetical protein HY828_08135 [Actinobacteria bacterium]|nr:hypothetical protein [Actinomycetota bacterium]